MVINKQKRIAKAVQTSTKLDSHTRLDDHRKLEKQSNQKPTTTRDRTSTQNRTTTHNSICPNKIRRLQKALDFHAQQIKNRLPPNTGPPHKSPSPHKNPHRKKTLNVHSILDITLTCGPHKTPRALKTRCPLRTRRLTEC